MHRSSRTINTDRYTLDATAGGGIGMTFGQIRVDINATYRLLRYAVSVNGSFAM